MEGLTARLLRWHDREADSIAQYGLIVLAGDTFLKKLALFALPLCAFLAVPSSAATFLIDFDTPGTGSTLDSSPLLTPLGTVTGANIEIRDPGGDPEFIAAGASGNVADHLDMPGPIPSLSFSFDVDSISLIYGGNSGDITIIVRDIGGTALDTFFQASTVGSQPAGPITFTAAGIRSLEWLETSGSFAAIDNVEISNNATVPEPSTIGLLLAGLAFFGIRRRRSA